MKHKIINLLILIITLSIVLFFTLKDDFIEVVNELKNINAIFVIISIFILLIAVFIKSVSLNIFLKKKSNKSLRYTYFLTLIGQFVSGITPFSSGGQPYEIYLLKKDGVRITDSTNAMIKDFISYQFALIIIALIVILHSKINNTFPNNSKINLLIWLGFLINLVILFILLLILFAKPVMTKLVDRILKINIVNTTIKNKNKIKESLNNFYSSGAELKKEKWTFIKGIFLNFIYLIILYSIPIFILSAFRINNIYIIDIISATTFVMLIGNSVPIPGGSGGIEYSFMQFFRVFTKGATLSGVMIIWRFVTYIVILVIGFMLLIIKKGSEKNENRIVH